MIDKAEEYEGMTLAEALAHADENRWRGQRARSSNLCQARHALEAVTLLVRPDLDNLPLAERLTRIAHSEVRAEHLRAAVRAWRKTALAPVTINRRVVCLSVLGYETRNLYTPLPKKLKWWLKPDQQAALSAWLLSRGSRMDRLMVHYIDFVTQTGLRVEEALRLTRADFSSIIVRHPVTGEESERLIMTVPGLKTSDAQATLPLSARAEAVFRSRLGLNAAPAKPLFAVSYGRLAGKWRECKIFLRVEDNSNATLKALRRVAARNLHAINGMPLDVARTYLRHENIQTTMGYLRLTGGYGADEIARYLEAGSNQ